MQEHTAAFRSIAGAIEDVELDELDDEIDRTALLADVRATIARLEQERPHVRDPGFWVAHVHDAVGSLLGRAPTEQVASDALARITALPSFLDGARATIRRPPVLLVDAALTRLGPTGELLVRAASELGPAAPGGAHAMNAAVTAALQALTRFGVALRNEIEPEADWSRAALGEQLFERRVHEAYAVRSSPAELARWAAATLDRTAAALAGTERHGVPDAASALVAAQESAIAGLPSPIRRAIRSPMAVEGWALYASGVDAESDPRWLQRLREAAARLAVDVGLHARGMSPAEAARFLRGKAGMTADAAEREIARIAAGPTRGLAGAAGYREIIRLREAYASERGPDREGFHAALLRYGALPPGLAGWGMGLVNSGA